MVKLSYVNVLFTRFMISLIILFGLIFVVDFKFLLRSVVIVVFYCIGLVSCFVNVV